MTFDITTLVVALIVALGAFAAGWIIKGKKAADEAVPPDWHWLLQDAAGVAVRAAEQAIKGNSDKYAFAFEYVSKTLAQYGIKLDPQLIRGAVEGAVAELKRQILEDEAAGIVKPANQLTSG